MPQDRRSFIKKFGATLGSLIVSGSLPGCGPKKDRALCETTSAARKQNKLSLNAPVPSTPEWRQLGQCWLRLKTLDKDITEAGPSRDQLDAMDALDRLSAGERWRATRDAMLKGPVACHQGLLDALVTTGELDEPVAKYMQMAFEEAIRHIDRSMSTCYAGIAIGYAPREDLLQQAGLLDKMWRDLDRWTVEKAQAAIAQDIAFFEMIREDNINYVFSGGTYVAGDLKVSPEALEAARLLTRLFLETPD